MRLSTQLSYQGGFQEAARTVVELERVGLDVVWVAEAYGFDAVSLMGYLAALTERVEIGSGILPIYTRTPTLLAMSAAGVDALSDGRCILGIGASGPQVVEGWHGVPYDRPLARTREIIDICRRVWEREAPLTNPGPRYPLPLPEGQGTGLGKPLKIIAHPVRPRIPVYVAALGAKNVALTAEVADGWLPLFFLPERAKEVFGPALAEGAARRPDDLGPLEICAGGVAFIGDADAALKVLDTHARPMMALYIGGMGAKGRNFYNDLVRRYGYEAEAAEIQDLYLSGHKREAAARVPEELLQLTNLCGPPDFVRDRIAAFREAGVTLLNVLPAGPDPVGTVAQLKDWL
ncbi:MAG TPA: LLM class F420-dependent oxidoreductase [Acidimicrobiales bacterium]